jgi:hypothetical protein
MAGECKGKSSHEQYAEIRAVRGDRAPKSGRRGRGRWRGRGCLRGCGLEWRLGHGLARGFVVFAFGVMLASRWTRSERVRVGVRVGVRCRAQYGTGKRGAVAVQVQLKVPNAQKANKCLILMRAYNGQRERWKQC